MIDESSSITVIVPPCCPTFLNSTDSSQNLIVLNVNAQALLKLTAINYSAWRLQFTYLLFRYNLFGFVDSSKSCPPAMLTLLDVASPSSNPNHILWLRQDQLLLNAIVGSVSSTLVQFISTSATSCVAWTTLEKKYVSHSHRQIITHCQNLASPQQGNRSILDYVQDVKHNIDHLAIMNVSIDFDKFSICVLNGLGPAYSHISHDLRARILQLLLRNSLSTYLVKRPNLRFWFLLHCSPPLRPLP